MADDKSRQESKVEKAKASSRYLHGTIQDVLASDASHFEEDDKQVLKFHGTYQQDDRDQRRALRAAGEEKAYMFMVRVGIPGGRLTCDQYLSLDRMADAYANGSLRVTTRQGIQFHGVLKGDLKATIAEINQALLTTLAACGDVERNVMASPAPVADAAHRAVQALAREIGAALRPATRAYHEIWLDEEKVVSTADEEPFYGPTYLPRKFKTGVTLAGDNAIDVYSYDVGLIALTDDAANVIGYNLLVGGGMGMTHKKADTFARIGEPLGFVEPDHAVEAVRTVAAIFRDNGNRADRRHARLKYLIDEWGMDTFRREFQKQADFTLYPWRPIDRPAYRDYIGKHAQGDGRFFYGLFVENGRIVDRGEMRLKSALAAIAGDLKPGFVLTGNQNVLISDLEESAIADVEETLVSHGVILPEELSAARRYSMACPALPTCGLAMAESERLMPDVVNAFEAELARLGMRDVPITLRMTGCPNGCARPYTADIAFVGKAPDVYNVYVGGGLPGDRMADLYADAVPTDQLVSTMRPLLEAWVRDRRDDEGLGDYYQRLCGQTTPRQVITGKEEATRSRVELKVLP